MPAVLVDWSTTEPTARIVFIVLMGLGAGMVVRAELAARRPPARTDGPTAAYLEHIGFTLIALANGFAVVAAIRGGVPGWAIGRVPAGEVRVWVIGLRLLSDRVAREVRVVPRSGGATATS